MRFSWKKRRLTEELVQIPEISGDSEQKGGLMAGVEKGFFEAFLFTFSMILHLSHSLEGEHGTRL